VRLEHAQTAHQRLIKLSNFSSFALRLTCTSERHNHIDALGSVCNHGFGAPHPVAIVGSCS
jgi:hypothetical protein